MIKKAKNDKQLVKFCVLKFFEQKIDLVRFCKNYNIFFDLTKLSEKELLWFLLIEIRFANNSVYNQFLLSNKIKNPLFLKYNINNQIFQHPLRYLHLSASLQIQLNQFIWGYFCGYILLNT